VVEKIKGGGDAVVAVAENEGKTGKSLGWVTSLGVEIQHLFPCPLLHHRMKKRL